ncbi:unnamed protein product, partial [Rotaria sordida]
NNNNNNDNTINYEATGSNNIRLKLAQSSSYYQTTSSSIHTLNDVLNQSNISSSSRLSPQFTLNTGGNDIRDLSSRKPFFFLAL